MSANPETWELVLYTVAIGIVCAVMVWQAVRIDELRAELDAERGRRLKADVRIGELIEQLRGRQ